MMQQRQRRFSYLSKHKWRPNTEKSGPISPSPLSQSQSEENVKEGKQEKEEKKEGGSGCAEVLDLFGVVEEEVEEEDKEGDFDSLSITAGTAFMSRLSGHFDYFIR